MKERPILFSGAMVRALLDGTKTQTRRALRPDGKYRLDLVCPTNGGPPICPYGQPGDRLWARETFFAWGRWETRFSTKKGRDEWHFVDLTDYDHPYLYAANGVSDTQAFIKRRGDVQPMYWKRPAIFMPRAASRITLEITSVRVERLQDISEADAMAEGVDIGAVASFGRTPGVTRPAGFAYRDLWESINPAEIPLLDDDGKKVGMQKNPAAWDANPWVWVIEFKRI
jgi:hypothetical protein